MMDNLSQRATLPGVHVTLATKVSCHFIEVEINNQVALNRVRLASTIMQSASGILCHLHSAPTEARDAVEGEKTRLHIIPSTPANSDGTLGYPEII
jgi:hypothetical protein